MVIITKLIVEQSARSITSFISDMSPETKKGNHHILLVGGVDVEVEIKAGLENKLIIIAKVANCTVYRTKVNSDGLWEIQYNPEALYKDLTYSILESLYDNALLNNSSLMKLISAASNRHVKDTTIELPAGYVVELKSDDIIILNEDKEHVLLQEFIKNGYPLSPALSIPKSISYHMVSEDFKPFNI